uniref:Uncharacterized protein n=1 Tax=uncultured marine virus TaxID=186617 RepID=A0A0F7L4Y3_9VIRU|nr:hypothetical protein [uncultured marine virus]
MGWGLSYKVYDANEGYNRTADHAPMAGVIRRRRRGRRRRVRPRSVSVGRRAHGRRATGPRESDGRVRDRQRRPCR